MNAVPKTWLHDDQQIRTVPMPAGAGVWVQCEVTHPPSMAGRSVNVFVSPELVVPMLKELRSTAGRARSKAMSS